MTASSESPQYRRIIFAYRRDSGEAIMVDHWDFDVATMVVAEDEAAFGCAYAAQRPTRPDQKQEAARAQEMAGVS